ncbi:hypothetical protein ACQ4PT_012264 [Festuca glaucescens]
MEQGARMAPRRSVPLHPKIQPPEDSAGVACRRSTRLYPQVLTSEEVAGVTRRRRRRRTSTAAAAPLPDDDDMLREILLRLPPQPSSLLRASVACKRWRASSPTPGSSASSMRTTGSRLSWASSRGEIWSGGSRSTPSWILQTAYLRSASTLGAAAAAMATICSTVATVLSSSRTARGQSLSCATPSPGSSAAWPFRRSSRHTSSTGQCSVLPATRTTCTAPATRAHSRWC